MGFFKLGKMTFGSLFKQPETIQYPFVEKPKPEGLKGHIAIDVNDCILCGMCDRSCAADCIKVDKAEGYWEIDRYGCIQCGYCITVCPKKCLHMAPEYAPAVTERKADRFDVPKQGKAAAKPADTETGAKPKPEPKPAAQNAPEKNVPVPDFSDEQLLALIGLMDADKAAKVQAALGL